MTTFEIEEVYTGGGCEQLDVRFPEYDVQFNIQVHDDQSIPKDGERFCFILCKLGSTDCDDYIEISESFDNFNRESIGKWCEGYLAAKGISKTFPPIREYECYFLDLLNPSSKSVIQYHNIDFFNQGDYYDVNDINEIIFMNVGDKCNKSYDNVEHWIRRIK